MDEHTGVELVYPSRKQAAFWATRHTCKRRAPIILEGPNGERRRYHWAYSGQLHYRIPCPEGCGGWAHPRTTRGAPPAMCRECRNRAGQTEKQKQSARDFLAARNPRSDTP